MSEVPFKIIRTRTPKSETGFSLVNKLAALPYKPRTQRYFKYRANPDNAFAMAFFEAAMNSETVISVSEHIFNLFGTFNYDYDNSAKRQKYTNEINRLLADSPEGHILVTNHRVAVLAGVRAPVWFRRLPAAQQAQIPVRSAADQVGGVGYNASNLPAVVGQSYDGVRSDYMALSSLGVKWRNPGKIARIKRADTGLGALAVNDAETREKMEAYAIALEQAQAETAEAKTELAALMARNTEAIIAAQASSTAANAQTAKIAALLSSPDKIVISEPSAIAFSDEQSTVLLSKLMEAMNARFDSFAASQQAPAAPQAPVKAKRVRKAKAAATA